MFKTQGFYLEKARPSTPCGQDVRHVRDRSAAPNKVTFVWIVHTVHISLLF